MTGFWKTDHVVTFMTVRAKTSLDVRTHIHTQTCMLPHVHPHTYGNTKVPIILQYLNILLVFETNGANIPLKIRRMIICISRLTYCCYNEHKLPHGLQKYIFYNQNLEKFSKIPIANKQLGTYFSKQIERNNRS